MLKKIISSVSLEKHFTVESQSQSRWPGWWQHFNSVVKCRLLEKNSAKNAKARRTDQSGMPTIIKQRQQQKTVNATQYFFGNKLINKNH